MLGTLDVLLVNLGGFGTAAKTTRDFEWGDRRNGSTPRIRYYQTRCMAITCLFWKENQERGSDGDEGVSMM